MCQGFAVAGAGMWSWLAAISVNSTGPTLFGNARLRPAILRMPVLHSTLAHQYKLKSLLDGDN